MQKPIYFDHASTTPLDKRVLEEMYPWLTTHFGNANSIHQIGQTAKVALEEARESIAALLHVKPSEVIFTSGGTESNNAAIKGLFQAREGKMHLITSQAEHKAVGEPVTALEAFGAHPVRLRPDSGGRIDPQQVAERIDGQTALVSIMHVNNELGTVNPVAEIADVCRERGVPFHSDCVQSIGKVPVRLDRIGADLVSISGHKFYGPKGTGVLIVREGTPWVPWIQGGSQERGRRGGTANVAGAVGLRKALELAVGGMEASHAHCTMLGGHLLARLEEKMPGRFALNTPPGDVVPHILNIRFNPSGQSSFDGEMLLLNLDIEGICVSNGSACTSGAVEPSHVLMAIGLESNLANSSVRISFGRENTREEVDLFVEKLERVLNRMFTLNQSIS